MMVSQVRSGGLTMRLARAGWTVLGVAALALAMGAAKKDKGLVIPLKTSDGKDAGTATFKETKGGKLNIHLMLKNLPEGEHAVHIHQKPLCDAPDFKTAGGHFNPDMKQHGTMNPMGHHNGDLPQNISVGVEHTANVTLTVDYLSMGTGNPNDIVANGGTSIMVHEKPDDMKTDPTGNAGNRIACGVIMEMP
jgi:Cu-Zn family superoxide dismutase